MATGQSTTQFTNPEPIRRGLGEAGNGRVVEASKVERLPWIIFGAAVLFWIIFSAVAAPAYGGIDSFIFRDPGCALAAGDGFVSRSVPHGGASLDPQFYALYTPGAPLLFGLAAKLFGCTSYVATFYSLLFYTVAICLTLIALFRVIKGSRARVWIAAIAGVLLPSGLFFKEGDRPEEPAFCMLVGLLLLWKFAKTRAARAVLVGLSGVVFLFHPLAGLMGLMLFAYLLIFEETAEPFSSRFMTAVYGGLVFCVTVGISVLYMIHLDPTVVHRFLGHAFGADTGAGVVLNGGGTKAGQYGPFHGWVVAFRRVFAFQSNYLNGVLNISAILVSAVLFVYTLFRFAKGMESKKIWPQYFCLVAITLLFPLALFFAQEYYFSLTNGLLIVMLCLGGYALSDRARRSTAPLALLAVTILFTFPPLLVHVLQSIESRASYERASVQAARVARIFEERHVADKPILADYYQFYMYRPYFKNLYNSKFLEPQQATDAYKGLLICDTSQFPSPDNQKPWPVPLNPSNWQLVDSDDQLVRITLLGKPIMRRNWSWGCDAYVRK